VEFSGSGLAFCLLEPERQKARPDPQHEDEGYAGPIKTQYYLAYLKREQRTWTTH